MQQKDINEATAEELAQVPLITPKRAENIVEWRKQHGHVDDLAELKEVPGVGQKTVEKMTEFFTTGSGSGTQQPGEDEDETGGEDEDDTGEGEEGEGEEGEGEIVEGQEVEGEDGDADPDEDDEDDDEDEDEDGEGGDEPPEAA